MATIVKNPMVARIPHVISTMYLFVSIMLSLPEMDRPPMIIISLTSPSRNWKMERDYGMIKLKINTCRVTPSAL